MCGITGIINKKRRPIDKEVLWSMTDALAHRGPDDRGIYVDGSVGLGHRRLAIIDLSSRAHQPMLTEDKNFVIVYNGEVYNFKELRRELEDERIKFMSHSDAEVVLKSFAKWGTRSLNRFNGMFSFAIWDKEKMVLTLARDRYGVKPLYYWQRDDIFLFASEIKAFFKHPAFERGIDFEALFEYFTFQNTFTYKTLFKDVKLLPPGHIMQIPLKGRKKIKISQYWDFHFEEDKAIKREDEYLEELDRLFKTAIRRQLISDVEIGSFLSGGIDSGSIVAIASQEIKRLKTFCVGFDLSSASGMELSFDEREKARRISDRYQTEHHQIVLKSGDMQRSLPDLVWALEDLRLGQSYPNYYASELASRFVKVSLSGAGGDELFAGYPWRYYRALKSRGFGEYISGYYKYWQRLVPNKTLRELFSPSWNKVKDVWTEDIFKGVFVKHKLVPKDPEDFINHSLYFEIKTFLHGLLVVDDKLGMVHNLEVRLPFLDNDLVDFALKVPVRLKLRRIEEIINIDEDGLAKREEYFQKMHDGKMILRKVLGRYTDGEIAGQYKQGFSGPDASWFKGESIDYVKNLILDKKAHINDYLNRDVVRVLVEEHLQGKKNHRLFIWSLLCFEWWLRLF
ncbi:MAG: asparagine synthase (glutamine-hydrolyzing) [Candidatus Omnitrophica bacterium]|nr:asparagine synthase (glutamine-hydrolyzing) [Candidatus Omnitrophota bacterium]